MNDNEALSGHDAPSSDFYKEIHSPNIPHLVYSPSQLFYIQHYVRAANINA